MNLKEAIAVANQFNDTIFTNTQEMVNAVDVLIDYAESDKPEPITYQKIYEKMLEIGFLNPTTEKARQLSGAINAHFGTRRRNEPITGGWLQMNYNFICIGLDDEPKIVAFEKLAERINKKREVNDGNN